MKHDFIFTGTILALLVSVQARAEHVRPVANGAHDGLAATSQNSENSGIRSRTEAPAVNHCKVEDAHFRTLNGGCMDSRGLIWSKPAPSTNMTYRSAREYCLALNEGGQADWFLPAMADFKHITWEGGAETHFSWPVKFFWESFWTSERPTAKDAGTKTTDAGVSGVSHEDKRLVMTKQPNGWRTKVTAIDNQAITWNMEFAKPVVITLQRRTYESRQPLAYGTFRDGYYPYLERVDYRGGFEPMGEYEPDPNGDKIIPNDRAKAATVCVRKKESKHLPPDQIRPKDDLQSKILENTTTSDILTKNIIPSTTKQTRDPNSDNNNFKVAQSSKTPLQEKADLLADDVFPGAKVDHESVENFLTVHAFANHIIELSVPEVGDKVSFEDLQSKLLAKYPNMDKASQELWIRIIASQSNNRLNVVKYSSGSSFVYHMSDGEKKSGIRETIEGIKRLGELLESLNKTVALLSEGLIRDTQRAVMATTRARLETKVLIKQMEWDANHPQNYRSPGGGTTQGY